MKIGNIFKTVLPSIEPHPGLNIGDEVYIISHSIEGRLLNIRHCVDIPIDSKGQEVKDGYLGKLKIGSTDVDLYSHCLNKVLQIEPKYDWDYDRECHVEIPYGYEITWIRSEKN